MATYNIHEAKTQFSKLIESVQNGNEITISKAGKPIAILGPIKKANIQRVRGLLKGQVNLGTEFDEPLPEDVLTIFEGKP